MGLHRFDHHDERAAEAAAESAVAPGSASRPLDRLGLACLAWFAVFLCMTALAAVVIR